MINPGTTRSSNMSSIVGTFLLGTSFRTKFPQFPSYKSTTNHYTVGLLSRGIDELGINFPLQIAVSSNSTPDTFSTYFNHFWLLFGYYLQDQVFDFI